MWNVLSFCLRVFFSVTRTIIRAVLAMRSKHHAHEWNRAVSLCVALCECAYANQHHHHHNVHVCDVGFTSVVRFGFGPVMLLRFDARTLQRSRTQTHSEQRTATPPIGKGRSIICHRTLYGRRDKDVLRLFILSTSKYIHMYTCINAKPPIRRTRSPTGEYKCNNKYTHRDVALCCCWDNVSHICAYELYI